MNYRERAEATLQAITAGTAAVTGDDFFRSLVQHLAVAFQVSCAFVTECKDQTSARVQTLAFLANDRIADNFEYELAGTPCELVIGGQTLYVPEQLGVRFPREAREGSYLGMPLRDATGKVIGHLAVLDNKPMRRDEREMTLLATFATRASVELERRRTEMALQQSQAELRAANLRLEDYNRNLEQIVAERTREIERQRRQRFHLCVSRECGRQPHAAGWRCGADRGGNGSSRPGYE